MHPSKRTNHESPFCLPRQYLPERHGRVYSEGVWFDPAKRARQVCPADYDRFDRIFCMDASNLRLIKRFIPEDPAGKIHLMMSYTGVGRDVADPWYTGDFETTFQDILSGCEAMLSV